MSLIKILVAVRSPDNNKNLDTYEPNISRFSPTRTPSPWDGVRVSDRPGPACPQKIPDINDERTILEKMPKGRLEYLKRLMPYLKNQSEDCLYLNIFTPLQSKYSFHYSILNGIFRHCVRLG